MLSGETDFAIFHKVTTSLNTKRTREVRGHAIPLPCGGRSERRLFRDITQSNLRCRLKR